MRHTPTPWKTEKATWGENNEFFCWPVYSTSGAHPFGTDIGYFKKEVDAKLAMHACNVHDELVASAQTLCKILGRMHVSEEIGQALAALNASLAKAKDK